MNAFTRHAQVAFHNFAKLINIPRWKRQAGLNWHYMINRAIFKHKLYGISVFCLFIWQILNIFPQKSNFITSTLILTYSLPAFCALSFESINLLIVSKKLKKLSIILFSTSIASLGFIYTENQANQYLYDLTKVIPGNLGNSHTLFTFLFSFSWFMVGIFAIFLFYGIFGSIFIAIEFSIEHKTFNNLKNKWFKLFTGLDLLKDKKIPEISKIIISFGRLIGFISFSLLILKTTTSLEGFIYKGNSLKEIIVRLDYISPTYCKITEKLKISANKSDLRRIVFTSDGKIGVATPDPKKGFVFTLIDKCQ